MTPVAPGTAGRLSQLYRLEPEPLYGEAGSAAYDRMVTADRTEINDVMRLARRCDGPILELACGSGRLTFPLAARGHHVVAIDNSAPMLEMLAERAAAHRAHIETVEADMTSFTLPQRFALAVLGTSSICLLDARARRATLRRIAEHLTEDGVLFVSILDFKDRRETTDEVVHISVEDDATTTLLLHFDAARGIRTTSLLREEVADGHTAARALYLSEVHLLGEAQLTEDLLEAGFTVTQQIRRPAADHLHIGLVATVKSSDDI